MTGDFDAGEAEYHISAEATPGTSGQSGPTGGDKSWKDIGFRKLLDDSVSRSHIHRPNWHMVYPVQSMSRSESFHPTSPFGAATNFNIQ